MLAPISIPELGHPLLALLVDRDADTRQLYAEFLRRAACNIEEAEDGRDALVKALTRQPDVIITETRLPGINGFDLCRILRDDPKTRETPIVVVTGDAFEADQKRARTAGATVVLIKPCLPDRLAQEIKEVLAHSLALRARARALSAKVGQQLMRADELLERSHATDGRVMLSRAHNRRDTTEPPLVPPLLVCPTCDQPLKYVKSHIGGVSVRHQEQWDYYDCSAGCGAFQYRQRTRKLRRVS